MRTSRKLLVALFAFLLVLPTLQRAIRILPGTVLGGVETVLPWPDWTFSSWFDGSLQPAFERKFEQRLAARPHLIKSWNQIHYSLFGSVPPRPGGTEVVIGKACWLFETAYLKCYNRKSRDRESALRNQAREVRQFQDALKARGISFLLVIAPSKVEIYPEFVPPALLEPGRTERKTAYDRMIPLLREEGVQLIDAHAWFQELKPASPYPLFAKSGTHWNYYGAALVAGRIFKELERLTGRNLPDIAIDRVETDWQPEGSDADLLALLNIWGWPSLWNSESFSGTQLHPVLLPDPDSAAVPPNLLVIGDSFCLTLTEIMDRVAACRAHDTLYYFKRTFTYPSNDTAGTPIDPSTFDAEAVLAGRDAVIIEAGEHRLPDIGFGFMRAVLERNAAPKN